MNQHVNPVASPVRPTTIPVISFAPVVLATPERGDDLHMRVSAPATGDNLPLIIFSHGNGQSLYGYGPLANHWAAHGFVVIQPTHLDSRMLGLSQDDPRRPDIWHFREQDLVSILGRLDEIEQSVEQIRGRIDRSRIAVAGHSWGAQTASMLLGATHTDPRDGSTVDIADARIKVGVLLAIPGTGGANLSEFAAKHFPFMDASFSAMKTPALIVAGDNDYGRMTTRGPDWWTEAYELSPGEKALFTVFGGEHSLGGVAGYEVAETTDENPERLAAVQRISTAYLRSRLLGDDQAWSQALAAATEGSNAQGRVDLK